MPTEKCKRNALGIDGKKWFLTPEKSIDIQRKLGADLIVQLDECTPFHVDKKYKLIKAIGHGAYGVVISARDEETGVKVAIKKVANAFEDIVDAKGNSSKNILRFIIFELK